MEETIFSINDTGELIELSERNYDSELLLQRLLSDYPKLLGGSQINSDDPRKWILISRELGIPDEENNTNRWSLDHLFIDQDAIPTLVEVKRSTDTRIRREVIGQILDYAANGVAYWKTETIISQFEKTCELKNIDPAETLNDLIGVDEELEEFWENVDINLKAGKVRLLIVADIIPKGLRRIIEFLNGQMNPAEILGIEIKQYVGDNLKTLVPRVIGQTTIAQAKKENAKIKSIIRTKESFLEEMEKFSSKENRLITKKIIEWGKEKCENIWFGNGKLGRGSLVLTTPKFFKGKKYNLMPFAIWTNGTVEVYFQHYKNRFPMDKEINKMILLEKLNSIEGVAISQDNISYRPTFELNLLNKKQEFDKFIKAFEWFYSHFTR